MLWAVAAMCFFGFLRVGEVVVPSDLAFDPSIHLSATDISVDSHLSPTYVAVNIKVSKTDPFRRGVTIYLGRTQSYMSGGCHPEICGGERPLEETWKTSNTQAICLSSTGGAGCHRCGLIKVLQSQLLHRGSYDGSGIGSPGLSYQNDGKVGEFSLPFAHLYPKRHDLRSGKDINLATIHDSVTEPGGHHWPSAPSWQQIAYN